MSPDGGVYVADTTGGWWWACWGDIGAVYKVTEAFVGLTGGLAVISSADGRELYMFDGAGQHQGGLGT